MPTIHLYPLAGHVHIREPGPMRRRSEHRERSENLRGVPHARVPVIALVFGAGLPELVGIC